MTRWTAIWHHEAPVLPLPPHLRASDPLAELTLQLEFTVPPQEPYKAMRLWQGDSDPDLAVALYLMPDAGLRLVHGGVDLSTPAGFARMGETVCLRYRACARGRRDIVDLENTSRGTRHRLRAACDQPICLADVLPRDPRFLHICHIAAIAPFGIGPTNLPGLVEGTRVQTPDGPVPVEHLHQGLRLTTADGSTLPLQWIEARPHLSLGRRAPIRLRAPYFGLEDDIIVTPETRLLRVGPAVEYVCGTEAVLVEAQDLATGPAAQRDQTAPVRMVYHLMLDAHACLLVDRCALETALLADVIRAEDMAPRPFLAETDKTPCAPVLDRSGALALASVAATGSYARW